MKRVLTSLLLLALAACNQDSLDQNGIEGLSEDRTRYDETKHFSPKERTIIMYGDSLQVVDMDSVYIFQGDIRISKNSLSEFRGAVRTDRRWNDNTVHYQLSDFPSSSNAAKQLVYKAIKGIENKTYLNFIPKVQNDGVKSYINISYTEDKINYAYSDHIGRKPNGVNNVVIPKSMLVGSYGVGVAIHEICHALGMYHEQSRVDRDQYINVDFTNAKDEAQFKTYKDRGDNGRDIGPFDFNSIMLYGSFDGAKDPMRPVMTKKDGSYFFPQNDSLSQQDVQSLIHLYPAGRTVKFEDSLGDFETYQDLGLTQIRQRVLKCPEPTSIQFDIKYKFTPSYEHYSKGVKINSSYNQRNTSPITHRYPLPDFDGLMPEYPLPDFGYGQLSEEDCSIKLLLEVENQLYNKQKYTREITLNDVIQPWATEKWNLNLPQGYYKVRIRLVGEITSNENRGQKEKILEKILYSTKAFLTLESASINGVAKTIPSEFRNKYRHDTFVQL